MACRKEEMTTFKNKVPIRKARRPVVFEKLHLDPKSSFCSAPLFPARQPKLVYPPMGSLLSSKMPEEWERATPTLHFLPVWDHPSHWWNPVGQHSGRCHLFKVCHSGLGGRLPWQCQQFSRCETLSPLLLPLSAMSPQLGLWFGASPFEMMENFAN